MAAGVIGSPPKSNRFEIDHDYSFLLCLVEKNVTLLEIFCLGRLISLSVEDISTSRVKPKVNFWKLLQPVFFEHGVRVPTAIVK